MRTTTNFSSFPPKSPLAPYKKLWLAFLLTAAAAQAQFTIVFDYTYDTEEFFTGTNLGRQTYLEAVGTYVSNLLSPTALNAITPSGGNN